MTFDPTTPQPAQRLSDSQPILLSNNVILDSVFGIDHYPYSDGSGEKGFHNQVTTPLIQAVPPATVAAHAVTTAVYTRMYTMQDNAELGLLQYSRGPNNAKPTPVTAIQSPLTPLTIGPSGTSPIMDFVNIQSAIAEVSIIFRTVGPPSLVRGQKYLVVKTGGVSRVEALSPITISGLIDFAGNILQIQIGASTSLNLVEWTLQFNRITPV